MEKSLSENARLLNLADDMKTVNIKIESIEKIIQQLSGQLGKGGASSEEMNALSAQMQTIRIEIEDFR